MAAQDDFFDDPAEFMRNNVVIQSSPNEPPGFQAGSIYYFTVKHLPQYKVANVTGANVYAMHMTPKTSPPSLKAYYCPYRQNDGLSTMLGNEARYVFTPTMDGCTVGLGSYDGSGGRSMRHQNSGRSGTAVSPAQPTPEARAQQRKMQKNLILSELGLNASLIDPTMYQTWDVGGEVNGDIKTTTWGQHKIGQDWSFFTTSYIKIGQHTFLLRDVRQVF